MSFKDLHVAWLLIKYFRLSDDALSHHNIKCPDLDSDGEIDDSHHMNAKHEIVFSNHF